jgi:hypothetical protein
LAASVPATDWKTRSTGAPRSISWIDEVTWVSTQPWVGMSKRAMSSSSSFRRSVSAARLSEAGLMPMVASPVP